MRMRDRGGNTVLLGCCNCAGTVHLADVCSVNRGLSRLNKRATIFTAVLNAAGYRLCNLFKIVAFCPSYFIAFGAISSTQFSAFDGQMAVPAAHPIFGRR